MNVHSIDWRQSTVRQLFSALSLGLDANAEQFNNGRELDDAIEYQNDLYGIGFVIAQTYIAGVVAHVNSLQGTRARTCKKNLLKFGNLPVPKTELTRMQLCDTMANYYKHRDEWIDWTDPAANRTTEFLRMAGFTQDDECLCTTAAKLLLGNLNGKSLDSLSDMLSSWRVAVIARAGQGHF